MKNLIVIFLLTLNAFALDSKTPGRPQKPAVSKPPVDSDEVAVFAQKNAFGQVFEDDDFQQKLSSLTNSLGEKWPKITNDLKSKFSKEIDRYNLSAVFGLHGNSIRFLGSAVDDIEMNIGKFAITADLYYKLELRPSFRSGKQMRKDIYVIGLRGSNTLTVGSEIRITFFREFDSKVDALSDWKPYGFDRIPKNAADVMNKLNEQDGLRVEILGNMEFSKAFSELMNSTNLSAVLGYDLFKALYMLDIYRYTDNEVRTRFMGTINRGTVKSSVGLSYLSKIKAAKFLPRWIREVFDVSFNINFSKSFNFFNEYPVETHVADYFFRFDTPSLTQHAIEPRCNFQQNSASDNSVLTSEAAFDEMIGNIRSGKFMALFNPNLKEERLGAAILQNASKAETLACLDRELPPYKKRVQHFFKGRMASNIFSIDFGPRVSRLVRNTSTYSNSQTYVSSQEQGQEFNYYLLLNTSERTENDVFFGRWENEYVSDFDALYLSDKDKNIKGFMDFVRRIQYIDKSMSVSDLRDFSADLNRSIPENFPDRDKLLALIPKAEQQDAVISFVYTLSGKIIPKIEGMDKSELHARLANFIKDHPEKIMMNLPPDHSQDGFYGIGLNDYINNIFYRIDKFSDSRADSKERFEALKELMKDRVFTNYIFREFFPSLMSYDSAKDDMSIAMSISSKDIPFREDRIGDNQYSPVYGAVLLMRSILNDRSLDLRLETAVSPDGVNTVTPINIKSFRVY
ncbi:MAG: hypothetical protein JNL11_13795 [Bdellovibrionaceae bacterium]|nr:hypothetical protein [Pseudobdellovibrionaceae bacterium]